MKTNLPVRHRNTEPPRVDLDTLIARAARGNRAAIEEIARYLRPVLVAEARDALTKGEPLADAEDIAHDLFVLLLDATTRAMRRPARGVPWVRRIVRSLAEGRGDARAGWEQWAEE